MVPPATVTVPPGSRLGTFTLSLLPTAKTEKVTLTATYEGSSAGTAISVNAWPALFLDVGTTVLAYNESTTAKVTLNTRARRRRYRRVFLERPLGGAVPKTMTVSTGEFTGTFNVTTKDASATNSLRVGSSKPPQPCQEKKCQKGYTWNRDDCQLAASPSERNPWMCRLGQLCGENANENIGGSTRYVLLAITTAGRTLVSNAPARTPATTSPGFQSDSSDSSASSRLTEAALKSCRSSSPQESGQSILTCGESVANRSARADNSAAVSIGRRRIGRPPRSNETAARPSAPMYFV
jgi:hypothetical protein